MTDENGQMPDMSDKELKAAEYDQIMKCDEDYVDDLDFICNYMSALSDDWRKELVARIKDEAIWLSSNCAHEFHEPRQQVLGMKIIEEIGKQIYNENRL